MEIGRIMKSYKEFGMNTRKKTGQELEGVRDCLGFALLFTLMRKVSWVYGELWVGGQLLRDN